MAERVEVHIEGFHGVMKQVHYYFLGLRCVFELNLSPLPELEHLPSVREDFKQFKDHLLPLTLCYLRHYREFKARRARQPRPDDVPADYDPHEELGKMIAILEAFLEMHALKC
jgi:hypothetical protein